MAPRMDACCGYWSFDKKNRKTCVGVLSRVDQRNGCNRWKMERCLCGRMRKGNLDLWQLISWWSCWWTPTPTSAPQ